MCNEDNINFSQCQTDKKYYTLQHTYIYTYIYTKKIQLQNEAQHDSMKYTGQTWFAQKPAKLGGNWHTYPTVTWTKELNNYRTVTVCMLYKMDDPPPNACFPSPFFLLRVGGGVKAPEKKKKSLWQKIQSLIPAWRMYAHMHHTWTYTHIQTHSLTFMHTWQLNTLKTEYAVHLLYMYIHTSLKKERKRSTEKRERESQCFFWGVFY